ncbi:MAG: toll/interleukin-1 receptor domain-containing protein [Hyphomonadaceae bacterium]
MAYDVFIAYAPEDRDMAALVTRRLRALKFKVRFSKREEEPTFDDKDARDALKSQSMLVLWSEAALSSDWVRAAASIGHSRPGSLVQVGLDEAIPYDPFRLDKRYDLTGFTSRTTVEGWYQTVEELGRRDGRRDLRAWINIPSGDEDAKTEWLEAHVTDPLALHAKALRDKKMGIVPAAAASAGAAALAASAIGSGSAATKSPAPAAAAMATHEDDTSAGWLIPLVLLGIAAMLLFGWLNRSNALAKSGAANVTQLVQTCPAGMIPADMLGTGPLETGRIIVDE